jgi:hypothetical protein
VHQAVMNAAERDHEFVARLATESPGLHVPEVMRVGWLAAQTEHG